MESWASLRVPGEPRQRRALTLDEWVALPEDDEGELVDGFLEQEEVPDALHELAVAWLIRLFGGWLQGRGGFVFGSEIKLALRANRREVLPPILSPPNPRIFGLS